MVDSKLYSLLQVAELGSFTQAAKALSITQPAVSQHIRSLEQELNVRIFERQNGRLIVTRPGKEIIKTAKKIVALSQNLQQELQDTKTLLTHLTIGVTPTVEVSPAAEALAKYCSDNNGISLSIITDSVGNLCEKLKTYALDFVITEDRIADAGVRHQMLDTDFIILAVSSSHPLATRNTVTLDELKKERLILRLPESGIHSLFAAHFANNNLSLKDFNIVLEIDNTAMVKELVRRNYGISLLPRSVCLPEIRNGSIAALPLEHFDIRREINMVYQEDFDRLDILRNFMDNYSETLHRYA